MDNHSPWSRHVSVLLISAMFWQPILVLADGIRVAPNAGNTSLDEAGNGVPVVNIATPNGRGLSHNTFEDYNVGEQGVILNNATDKLQSTQLGGLVVGNPNLRGHAAELIVNEVNGGRLSRLEGYTEVAGQAANVVVANPHGIVCDGCGFINSPRVTLSTGQPVIEDGDLERFAVDQGQVAIDGLGLDASQVDQFDIITRAAELNAELHAHQLNLVAGANDVDADTLEAERRQGVGEAPELAIDSAALGGMYANSIKLVGTERGVGVRLSGDMAASGGDIQIDVDGHLRLGDASSVGHVDVEAGTATLGGGLYGAAGIDLATAKRLDVEGDLTSGSDIVLEGGEEIVNRGRVIAGVEGEARQPDAELTLSAERVDNRMGHLAGLGLRLDAGQFDNTGGTVEANNTLSVLVDNLKNTDGDIRALSHDGESQFEVADTLDNRQGRVDIASRSLHIDTGELLNDQGWLAHVGTGTLRLSADTLSSEEGDIQGMASGQAAIRRLEKVGQWQFNDGLELAVEEPVTISAGERIASSGRLSLDFASLDNTGDLLANSGMSLSASGDVTNRGLISTQGDLEFTAHHLRQHDGRLASGGDSSYRLDGDFDNRGRLTAGGNVDLEANSVDNRGILGSQQDLRLVSFGTIANRPDSLMFAGGDMTLRAPRFFNRYGDIYSGGRLDFARDDQNSHADSLENRSGSIEAADDMRIDAASVVNTKDSYEDELMLVDRKLSADWHYLAKYYLYEDFGGRDSGNIREWRPAPGGRIFHEYDIRERYKTRVVEDSPQARLISGSNMEVHSDQVTNSRSLLAANGDLHIQANNLKNLGPGNQTVYKKTNYENTQVLAGLIPVDGHCEMWVGCFDYSSVSGNYRYIVAGFIPPDEWTDSVSNWNAKNGLDPQGNDLPLPSALAGGEQSSRVVTRTPLNSGDKAVISSGGQISLNVANRIDNGEIDNGIHEQLRGSLADTAASNSVDSLDITLGQRPGETTSPRVSPSQLSSFRLPEGRNGLFVRNRSPQSRYLIETNPIFTNVDRFRGSDYLLDRLEYSSDGAYRLLGDGRYESRLVRDAVLNQTGQRFLADGLSSDADQYRYLMDNAAAAQDDLQLTVGVGLTADQVSSLSRDIVWLEEQEVEGETVLAPVLYLAQVGSRNVRGNSLIQGRDLDLIAGGDIRNVGTLSADENLDVTSGGSILQGGLVESGERLAMSAQDSIRNAMAGEIHGGSVELEAVEGDIINDRTAVTAGHERSYDTYLDQGGLISARDDLSLAAGQDIVNRAEIDSRGDATFQAERDIVTEAVVDSRRQVDGYEAGIGEGSERITQLGASLVTGGDANLIAGRDVRLSASTVDASGALSVAASRDIRLDAKENAAHEWGSEASSRRWYGRQLTDERTNAQVGSRLSSGDDTRLSAGRDVRLTASEADSGAGLAIAAGNDVVLGAAENQSQTQTDEWNRESQTRSVDQAGSTVTAADDIGLQAGRHVAAIASRADAGGSLTIDAGGDLTLASAANVDHHESHTATTDRISRRVRQQGGELIAGENLALRAGRDLRLIGSEAKAGDEASLIAGRDAELLAAHDQDYSLYEKEVDGGLFGSSSYQRDEVNVRRAVGSQVESGGDLTVASGLDQRYQGARLDAGNDLTLSSGGTIRLEAASDIRTESHEKSSGNFAWQSSEGEGFTDETLRQSQLIAQGERVIQAVDGITIDMEKIDRQTVGQTIDAMVKADPELAWLKDMEARGDVDWQQVKAIHDSWDYSQSGLSPVAGMAVAIIVAAATSGAASSAIGMLSGTTTAAGATTAASAWAAGTATAASGWANAALSGAIAGSVGGAAGALSQGKDWQDPALHGAITGGFANYLAGGTYYKNPLNKVTDFGEQISQGSLLDAGKVLGSAAMQKAWSHIAEKMAKGVGLSEDELNWMLMASSIAGDQLPGIGNRYKPDDQEFKLTDYVGERGVMDRGLQGLPFDAADIALGYQGLPEASVRAYLVDQGFGGASTGHSLGTLSSNYLVSNGLAEHAELFSLPFGNIAAPDVHLTIGSGDLVNGGFLGKIFNPDAIVAPITPLQHPFNNYKAFIDANPDLYQADR
ncbi:filamentous hemagglutinin family N-terminal domain-containing protein [Onishia taeanensis]|uniref:Filamentous hemagglutinin family N-terminal domain-containing protein n=1 Tax=Onishia taeanensis TaxID=284577 RepID=A0A1G7PCH6_9GAMM|nr:hemagglutinin repeat-containing protein [Halomonas taeanensis]SDF83339.1 filamentous hemagglutinin family N-terminal domain-containing protein [Halomonas taeanensis]